MSKAIPPLTLHAFMAETQTTLTLVYCTSISVKCLTQGKPISVDHSLQLNKLNLACVNYTNTYGPIIYKPIYENLSTLLSLTGK